MHNAEILALFTVVAFNLIDGRENINRPTFSTIEHILSYDQYLLHSFDRIFIFVSLFFRFGTEIGSCLILDKDQKGYIKIWRTISTDLDKALHTSTK